VTPVSTRPARDGAVLNPVYRERLFATINESPFVRHMAMQIVDIGWGTSTFVLEPAKFRLQPFNVVHGGNIATLIDSATFWACFVALGSDEDGLTSVDLKLNYLAPAGVEPLRCEAHMIKSGKTLSYAEGKVFADTRLIAHGTSTLMRLPQLGVKLGIPFWA
jgi:uncharacterized protein (TIGR00369 family)